MNSLLLAQTIYLWEVQLQLTHRPFLHHLRVSATLLHQVAVWLCSGFDMLIGFNDTLTVFVPKGTDEDDVHGIVRDPSSTRPLGLKTQT